MSDRVHKAIDAAMEFDTNAMLDAFLALEYDPTTTDCELQRFVSATYGAWECARKVLDWRESGCVG